MADNMLAQEPVIRLTTFMLILALMVAWEWIRPRRPLAIHRAIRWPSNLGVVVVDTILVRLAFPTAAVGIALLAEARGWGLFQALPLPPWLEVLAAVILLDLVIYLQHVLFHKVPMLWRLHRMHHADLDVDVTAGLVRRRN